MSFEPGELFLHALSRRVGVVLTPSYQITLREETWGYSDLLICFYYLTPNGEIRFARFRHHFIKKFFE